MSTNLTIFVYQKIGNMVKKCEICGRELTTERHICKECKKAKKREYAKLRYVRLQEQGVKLIRYGLTACCVCGKELIKNRPDQVMCFDCYKKTKHKTVDNYNNIKRTKDGKATIGRRMVEGLGLNIKGMCVHHIDENPDNNTYSNYLILNRSNHAKLHRFLEKNWSLLLKNSSSNLENCWNTLRDQLTKTWLETMSVKVLKITDIGQSAAEPLNKDKCYLLQEEGSETMYQTPKDDHINGEDIVQTQNESACESKLSM